MRSAGETWLTAFLCGVCLLLAVVELWPRLTTRQLPLAFEAPDISVAVEGAVRQPGEYTLPFGATVADLVAMAGGLTGTAERTLVNLADPLSTGEMVLVPDVSTPAGSPRIDVNSAALDELDELPGVGPVTAARIIAGRPYTELDELLRVSGIGPKTLARLKPLVRL